jgi:hypothetical protein
VDSEQSRYARVQARNRALVLLQRQTSLVGDWRSTLSTVSTDLRARLNSLTFVVLLQKKTTAGTSGTEEGDGKGARAPQVKGRGKKPAAKKVPGSKATKGVNLGPEDESVAVKKKRAKNEVDTPSAVQVRRTRQKPSPSR